MYIFYIILLLVFVFFVLNRYDIHYGIIMLFIRLLLYINVYKHYLFSKKVLALIIFLPIAVAFHGQYEPEGSTWYKDGPLLS